MIRSIADNPWRGCCFALSSVPSALRAGLHSSAGCTPSGKERGVQVLAARADGRSRQFWSQVVGSGMTSCRHVVGGGCALQVCCRESSVSLHCCLDASSWCRMGWHCSLSSAIDSYTMQTSWIGCNL